MLTVEAPQLAATREMFERAQSDLEDTMQEAAADKGAKTWTTALEAAASTPAQRKLLVTGATVETTAGSFSLTAAAGPQLSGGLGGSGWAAIEFGTDPERIVSETRQQRVLGSSRKVPARIWVGRNLAPRNPSGNVISPAAREVVPAMVEAWTDGVLGLFDEGQ